MIIQVLVTPAHGSDNTGTGDACDCENDQDFNNIAAVLFDCPDASELARRRISYLSRCECGLQVHLGIVRGTDAHAAECIEIYSYSDTGEGHARFDEGIRETLLRIEHVGIWF